MATLNSPDERRAADLEWLRLNGLDPEQIGEHVEIVGGTHIRYQPLLVSDDGTRRLGDPRLIEITVPRG